MTRRTAIITTTLACAIGCSMLASSANDTAFDFEKLIGRSNLQQTPAGVSGQWSLEKLLALTQPEGMSLWRSLPAVPMKEMKGHYMGLIPCADDPPRQKFYADTTFNRGAYWMGKAFKPISETTGEGYNRLRMTSGEIIRKGRYATRIDRSPIDGKPSYIIDFGAFNNGSTIDELRKLEDFIYLGASSHPAENGQRSEPIFFVLIGPTDDWVGPDQN